MALPKHKTTLSVLRSILGPVSGSAARFAKKIGCTRSYVKKLSSGERPISIDVASLIAYETGICRWWLIANNPKAPPVDRKGKPYTQETFATHCTNRVDHITGGGRIDFDDFQKDEEEFCECILDAMSIFVEAETVNRSGYFVFLFEEFIRTAKKEFGSPEIRRWPRAAECALEVARYIMGCEKTITPRMFQEACKAYAREPQKAWRAEIVSKAMEGIFRRTRNARARATKPKNGGHPEGMKKNRKPSARATPKRRRKK